MPINMDDPDQKALVEERDRLNSLNQNLQTELSAVKSATADGNEALGRVAVLTSENSKLNTELETTKSKLNKIIGERDTAVTKFNELDSKVKTSTVENAITEALTKCDFDPRFSSALKAMHSGQFQLNEAGEIVSKTGETIEKFYEDFANSDDGKIYLSVGKQSGSGIVNNPIKRTQAGGVVNPWMKESFNRTEQLRITREKPELAVRLKADAGVK